MTNFTELFGKNIHFDICFSNDIHIFCPNKCKIWYFKIVCEWPNDKQTTHYACWNADYEILMTIYITFPTQNTHNFQNNDHFDKIMSQ
jgi:hypothetical protein